jgi:hypothetical protein
MEQLLTTSLIYFASIWVFFTIIKDLLTKMGKYNITKYMCLKCFIFWITLTLTFSIPIAAVSALMGYLFDNYLNEIKL